MKINLYNPNLLYESYFKETFVLFKLLLFDF